MSLSTSMPVAAARLEAPRGAAVGALAWIEARRMLRHPAPWIGLLLSAWNWTTVSDDWASARYEGLMLSVVPLLIGVSFASAWSFAREHTAVADEAPLSSAARSGARLLGGLALVGLVAVVVGAAALLIRIEGGIRLGDEPGRTEHAYYTLPELAQPVLLAAFAVALGAAVVHVVRQRLVAGILLFVYWFVVWVYWLFNSPVLRWLTPLQVPPVPVDVGPASTSPASFPQEWLLSTPGEYQEQWVRLVVSPSLAAWHDVYLVALTLLAVAVAVPGRVRRACAVAGAVLAVGAVLMQAVVNP